MKIALIWVGKTVDPYLTEGIDKYVKRLIHYCRFSVTEIPELKNTKSLSTAQQKEKEADLIMAKLNQNDFVILLDEHGKEFSSAGFANELSKYANQSVTSLVFVIGGPYGFDERVKQRANQKMSLSKLTFSHQMVRLFFTEQLYRAHTILKGEPYHHE